MVDGIGKGGPPRGVGGTPPTTGPAAETGKTFEVQKTREATAVEAPVTINHANGGALDQLKAGKIDFNQYVDMKVDEATSHLEGLSPAQLDSIRSMLRDRMATDPE